MQTKAIDLETIVAIANDVLIEEITNADGDTDEAVTVLLMAVAHALADNDANLLHPRLGPALKHAVRAAINAFERTPLPRPAND